MDRNIKVARELVRIAREILCAELDLALESWGNLEQVASSDGITAYKVDDWNDLRNVCSASNERIPWCVAMKGEQGKALFDMYGAPFFLFCKGKEPVALMHVASEQFKDTKDHYIDFSSEGSEEWKLCMLAAKVLEKNNCHVNFENDFKVFEKLPEDVRRNI